MQTGLSRSPLRRMQRSSECSYCSSIPPVLTSISIVAVHGMNLENNDDHADNAWTDRKSGTNWLRDLLPSRIPNGRILAYQYNANVAFGTSSAGVEEQAKNMLNCLWLERKVCWTSRPNPVVWRC
jgi:hypothetical protein